jgi:hypothetical protein
LSGGKVVEWPLPWLLKVDSATRWALYQRFIDLGYAVSEIWSADIIYMAISRR